jgi:manganese oxidase
MDSLKIAIIGTLVAIGVLSLLLIFQPHQSEYIHAESVTTFGPGQIRTYYIAADEVNWDYTPTGINQITGKPFDEVAQTYVKNDKDRIGHIYHKAEYREYTDNTFTKLKPVSEKWKHLGILGPVIHAVGDTINII